MIDYKILSQSVDFYKNRHFNYIETPWTVTEEISNITKPPEVNNLVINGKNKCLVASGEQSYLYLYLKGYLPKGQFQTITPCFREDVYDLHHRKCFMKNELIATDNVCTNTLLKIIEVAESFFNSLGIKTKVKQIDTYSYDIETLNGIELGSYGIRECEFLTWIYGTGCAEPRTSMVINNNIENGKY